jgi:hypothetical protein
MKIVMGISTFAYDLIGSRTVYITPDSYERMNSGARRVTRTKTLDGAAVAYDAGYAVADLTWDISIEARDEGTPNFIKWMLETYNLIRLSTQDGVFKVIPSRWSFSNGRVRLEALVMEKLT